MIYPKKRWFKRAQLSVFVILALLIAVVLVLIFMNNNDIKTILTGGTPINQIEKCVQDSTKEAIDLVSKQGGSINPKNYYLYEDNKVDYICYTTEYYKKCVMQKPLLKSSVESEIKKYVEAKASSCIESVKSSLEKKGYDVSYKNPEVTVEILPGSVSAKADIDLKISKSSTENYKTVKTAVDSNLYEFIITTSSIANWEARYGDTETISYMMYYPNLKVEKKPRSEGTKIYILTNRDSQDKFMFAIRSVAIPAGVTGK